MLAQVLVQVGDDEAIPGGIIGRQRSAAVWLDDPQISEAQAMVEAGRWELTWQQALRWAER